jgi:hypothetical protein
VLIALSIREEFSDPDWTLSLFRNPACVRPRNPHASLLAVVIQLNHNNDKSRVRTLADERARACLKVNCNRGA